ncbi:MAG: hypothetical protein K5912_01225 [Alphaproteobacteria bacterium]|nr:hypothetical protein [Alphaproteobacteria bacterium]
MYEIFYTGDGTTTEYVFNFPYFQDKDICVSVNSQILNSDTHSVVPAFDTRQDGMFIGGKVVLASPPNVGAEIRVWRKVDLSRTIDYQALSVLDPQEINADITFLVEYLKDAYAWDERLANIENAMQFLESIHSQITTLGTFNELARKSELPDLTPYALITDIPDVSGLAPANHSHSQYATTQDLSSLDSRVDTLENSSGTFPEGYDFVIDFQAPTQENNYTWYRKYRSGWVEQGGIATGNSNYGYITVTMPVEMADINYHATGSILWNNISVWYSGTFGPDARGVTDVAAPIGDRTTTTFTIQSFDSHSWEVKGMAA